MRRHHELRRPKLNEKLCPDEFTICVPKQCKLLGSWDTPKEWRRHLESLTQDGEIPPEYECLPECWTCDCKEGWELSGELAIQHACRVHDQIHRQALGLEQVSAIDVGFAIWERQTEFRNFLAIRIHVNKKRTPEQLFKLGLDSLTRLDHVPFRRDRKPCDERGTKPPDDCSFLQCCDCPAEPPWSRERCKELMELVCSELNDKSGKHHGPFPIRGVLPEDLSIFCDPEIEKLDSLDDVRLCICGVPIDIVNAEYNYSVTYPGSDADRGVFVDPLQCSAELKNDEQLLIGSGRVNPLVGGISVGSVTGQAGTLGAVVWDRTDGTPCILSNWHVLAGIATAQIGQPTYQPALFDGGTEQDVVAHLKRWHLGEEGDAALAELSGDRDYASGEILGLWHPISGYMAPRLNLEVRKWGRTTGFTEGFVDGIHLATNIDYGNGVVRFFKNQFHIAPLYSGEDVSQVGDSGSLVVTSFRPKDLEKDLKKLCDWIQVFGDVESRKEHCKGFVKEINKLLDDHKNSASCQRIRDSLKIARDEIELQCDHGLGLQGLIALIKRHHEKLEGICREVTDCAGFCAQIEKTFRRQLKKMTAAERICRKLRCHPQKSSADTEGESALGAIAENALQRDDVDELGIQLRALVSRRDYDPDEFMKALEDSVKRFHRDRKEHQDRSTNRAYYAVGLIFAGDTPGSPFGEFAVASELSSLEKVLRFSLRPVYEPRSSFRRLRTRPDGRRQDVRALRSRTSLTPGAQSADPRGGGPQPDLEPVQSGSQDAG